MRTVLGSTIALLLLTLSAAAQCGFHYAPVAVPQYYRSGGWELPGINDFNLKAEPNLSQLPTLAKVPGAKAYVLPHDLEPYVVEFPAQIFTMNNTTQRMHKMVAKAGIVQWKVAGKVIAYSYGLVPLLNPRRQDGKWVYEGEFGCIFDATFIDDKGDGVFRVLVQGPLTPDLIPAWVRKYEN